MTHLHRKAPPNKFIVAIGGTMDKIRARLLKHRSHDWQLIAALDRCTVACVATKASMTRHGQAACREAIDLLLGEDPTANVVPEDTQSDA